jgi:hypothetical protein
LIRTIRRYVAFGTLVGANDDRHQIDEIGASGHPVVQFELRKVDQKLKSRKNDSVIVRFATGTMVLRQGAVSAGQSGLVRAPS